ncbi:helix-turn-helix transcriptional regulator [Dermatophilus congolensis]|nr:helix-turn-helix transcriptional regulator [Dermatophilus congolensis]MBO3202323.1 helix-turn-helix transcriptional regulator [Dermatophilus congolensis]MBO3218165.1 helix-turn-helix transcriptional regulator [Dermatophilus congolensis]
MTGISTSTLSRLEHGQRKPSLELLLPISAALCVSFDDLVSPPRVRRSARPQRTRTDSGVSLYPSYPPPP